MAQETRQGGDRPSEALLGEESGEGGDKSRVSAEWWGPRKGESSGWIDTVGRSWVGLTVTSLLTLEKESQLVLSTGVESRPRVPGGRPPRETGQEAQAGKCNLG